MVVLVAVVVLVAGVDAENLSRSKRGIYYNSQAPVVIGSYNVLFLHSSVFISYFFILVSQLLYCISINC